MKFILNNLFQVVAVAVNSVPNSLQQPDARVAIAISLGAIAGALSRYYLTLWFAQRLGTAFPFGTFFINLSGCLLMGFFVTFALERVGSIPPEVKLMVTTGFLGAYTTFSTYGLETVSLLQGSFVAVDEDTYLKLKTIALAAVYWLGSAFLGITCIQIGAILARLGK